MITCRVCGECEGEPGDHMTSEAHAIAVRTDAVLRSAFYIDPLTMFDQPKEAS